MFPLLALKAKESQSQNETMRIHNKPWAGVITDIRFPDEWFIKAAWLKTQSALPLEWGMELAGLISGTGEIVILRR